MTVRVTDHAVLRYLERVQGFDIDGVRRHIASLCRGAVAIGANTVRAEGVCFEICGDAVTTVAPKRTGPVPPKTHRQRLAAKVAGNGEYP